MSQPIIYRLSAGWMLFAPAPFYGLLILTLFLPMPALAGLRANWFPYFALGATVSICGLAIHFIQYLRWRDKFLVIGDEGIVLLGLSIPWKYIENGFRSGVLILHVTDPSAVNLGLIPWPFRSSFGRMTYSIILFPRNDIRLPWWIFDQSFAEVAAVLHASEPRMKPEQVIEKAEIKRQGQTYSHKGNIVAGIVLAIGFAGFAFYLYTQDGTRAISTIIILLVLLASYWYAILR